MINGIPEMHPPKEAIMIKLDKSNIRLDAKAADKSEAIRPVGKPRLESSELSPAESAMDRGKEDSK